MSEPPTAERAALAMARRILAMPPGEYTIHLDNTHRSRPRWKIAATPAKWESARQEEEPPCSSTGSPPAY
mgnify:FL=1